MKNKLLKKLIIGTGSVSIGAGIVLSAPGIINSSQNKTHTNKDYISDYFDFNQMTMTNNWGIDSLMQDKDGNIWVGTIGKGLWKSTDGSTFTQITNGIVNNWYILSLMQDKDGNIWVGTDGGQGLWKSTDGSTFTQITNGIESSWYIYSLMQDKDGNIWVGTDGQGLWKSTDGSTFTKITNLADGSVRIESLMQDKDGNIWVGTSYVGLWKSTDGSTFTQITNLADGSVRIESLMQDKDGNIWVGAGGQGLWKSTDGSTFTQITNGIESRWYIYSLMQDKDGNIWVGTDGQGLWKSTDGSTFTQITNGIENNWLITSLIQDEDGNIWVSTNEGGLWKKTSEVIFNPESTHKTIEEEGQTIYISDKSITLNIPPADQIIIDGEIISKTKEITQYTFDSGESPHTIEISIAEQHYIILVYIVESLEEINYVSYNNVPDDIEHTYLDIFLSTDIVTKLSNNFLEGDSTLNFFEWISENQIWNGLFNEEDNLWNILQNNFEIGALKNIDRNMIYPVPSTTTISYEIFRAALLDKIDDLTNVGQAGLLVKLDLNQASVPINFGTNGATETYWDNVLFS